MEHLLCNILDVNAPHSPFLLTTVTLGKEISDPNLDWQKIMSRLPIGLPDRVLDKLVVEYLGSVPR